MHRRFDIQGLRAIAVLAVVCFHAGLPIPGGFVGVDVFFVISGFVITLTLMREWRASGKIDLPMFYWRRFKRLAPALSLVVLMTAIVGSLVLSPLKSQFGTALQTGIGAVLMSANAVIALKTGGYFQVAASDNPLLNMWSLSVEEQFYIVFPSVLLLSLIVRRRVSDRSRTALIAVAAIGLLSLAATALFFYDILSTRLSLLIGFYSPVSRAWEFAAGAGLALSGEAVAPRSRAGAVIIGSVGMAFIIGSFFIMNGSWVYPGPGTLIPILGSVAVIAAGCGGFQSVGIARVLSWRPFVFTGDISYSLYLWHWPLIVFAAAIVPSNPKMMVVAAALSFAPAIISYRYVEDPLRRYQINGRKRAASLFALVLGPTLAVCAALMIADAHGYWSGPIQRYQSAVDTLHASLRVGCGIGYVPPSPTDMRCKFNVGATGKPVYLVGDLNADHLSEAVIVAGRATKRPVEIVSKGGCAFLGASWSDQSDANQRACLEFVGGVKRLLGSSPKGTVILGLSDSLWRSYGAKVGPTRATETSDQKAQLAYLHKEFVALIRLLQNDGHRVILVQSVPKYITWDQQLLFEPSKCMTLSALNGHCPRKVEVTTRFEDDLQRDARAAIANAARETGSKLIDARKALCPGNQCSNIATDGSVLYRDAGHLSVRGSEVIAPDFIHALASE